MNTLTKILNMLGKFFLNAIKSLSDTFITIIFILIVLGVLTLPIAYMGFTIGILTTIVLMLLIGFLIRWHLKVKQKKSLK